MYITRDPNDKYAFLFSGSKAVRYENDIKTVYDTLTSFYAYPKSQVWVVFGNDNDPPNAGFDSTFFNGANYVEITNQTEFETAWTNYGEAVKINSSAYEAPDGPRKSSVVYISGKGANTGLLINAAGDILGSNWFNDRMNYPPAAWPDPAEPYLRNSYSLVIMQQAYAGQFSGSDGTLLANKTFIAACGTAESMDINVDGDNTGSYFTAALMKALQFDTIPSGANAGKYADELDAFEELIIDMKEAYDFALDYCQQVAAMNLVNSPSHNSTVAGTHCLGKPELSIRDGDQQAPAGNWWESPDIWLTCTGYYSSEGNDYYVYEEDNIIHIRVNISGTHPVRLVYTGSKVFRSGGGGPGEVHTATHTPAAVLKPGDSSTYTYTYFYEAGFAHSCIKARLSLELIQGIDIDDLDSGGLAVNEWDPHNRNFEAQRNTDPSGLKSSSGGAGADPGEGKADEEAPGEDAKPETDSPETETDTKSTKNLRSYKEHVYIIKNNFRGRRDFMYLVDPELIKDTKRFVARWFALDHRNPERMKELRPVAEPVPHIPLMLGPGRELHILNYIGLNKGIKVEKPLRLKFDINVGTKCVMKVLGLRLRSLERMPFRSWSGVTMIITDGSFTLKGIVRTGKKVLPDRIFVIAETIDGRQSAAAPVDEKGNFIFSEINPDIYRVWARCGKISSKKIIIHGQPLDRKAKERPVIIDLD